MSKPLDETAASPRLSPAGFECSAESLTWDAPGSCSVAASNAGNSTYAPAVTVVSFNIVSAPQTVTVTADTDTETYGFAGTYLASYTADGFTEPDTFTTTPTCAVYRQDDPTYTTPLTIDGTTSVGVYVSHCSGAAVPDGYNLTYVDGVVTIAKVTLTVTPAAKAVTYGDAAPTYTFGVTGFVNGQTADDAAGYASPSCGSAYATTTSVAASPVAIGCSGGSATNYSFDYAATADLTITKAMLTVTPEDDSVAYGGSSPQVASNVTGFLNGQDAGSAAGYAAPSCGAPAYTTTTSVTASPMEISCTAGSATDYAFDVSATSDLTIEPAVLTVTPAAKAVAYSDAAPTYTFGVTGFVNGQTADDAAGYTAPSCGSAYTTATSVAASPVTIGCSGGSATDYTFDTTATDYTFDTTATADLTINQALLTVTPDAQSVVYGDAAPTYTSTVTGFVNGQDAGNAAGYNAPTCGSLYSSTTPVGSVPISCTSGSATDYSFNTTLTSEITVGKKTLVITPQSKAVRQGSPPPAYTWEATGFVNDQNASTADGFVAPTCGSGYTASTSYKASSPIVIACTGGAADNYQLDTSATATMIVMPPPVQVPMKSCVVVPKRLPLRGRTLLLKPRCVTNMGKKITVRAGASSRGDIRTFRILRKSNGAVYVLTYGKRVAVKLTWQSGPAGPVKGYREVATVRAR